MFENKLNTTLFIVLGLFLASCGSSGSGGDGSDTGNKSFSKGEITTKDAVSVTVNGTQYSTTSADIVTEDISSPESALSEGMVVTVTSSDGVVVEIEYDEELEGPIADIPSGAGADLSFTVLGATVVVNADTVYEGAYTAAAITKDDVVEVSGFYQADGSLLATYIELEGTYPARNEAEIRGIITGLTAAADEFTIGGATIKVGTNTILEGFTAGLQEGLYVEAEGRLQDGSYTVILASEIEYEDELEYEHGSEVEFKGLVTDYVSFADFMVAGTKVDARTAELRPADLVIANGMIVEVKGTMVDGVLVAVRVKDDDSL